MFCTREMAPPQLIQLDVESFVHLRMGHLIELGDTELAIEDTTRTPIIDSTSSCLMTATPTTWSAHSATTAQRGVAPSPRGSLPASTYLLTSSTIPSRPSSPLTNLSTAGRSEGWTGRAANELSEQEREWREGEQQWGGGGGGG